LIRRLLVFNPTKRATADEALSMPFVQVKMPMIASDRLRWPLMTSDDLRWPLMTSDGL